MSQERAGSGVDPATGNMLRHVLATLAYRGSKAVSGADPSFGDFRPSDTSRSAVEVVAHMGDLMEWIVGFARGQTRLDPATPLAWEDELDRFFRCLARLDGELAAGGDLGWSAERMFQGPLADALTHVGQLAMMRRLAGSPVQRENYARATIVAGSVGPEQGTPRRELD